MSYYPAFLALEGRSTVVVGGGAVAESKVESLLATGAAVRVVAPDVTERLRALAREGTIEWSQRPYAGGDLAGAFVVISATGAPAVDDEVAREARERGALVNVVDDPRRSDFIAPAVLRRGDLVVAVSTSGAAPAVAARIRDRLAREFGREWQVALELLRAARGRLRAEGRPAAERRRVLLELAAADLPRRIRDGDRAAVDRLIDEAVAERR